MYAGKYSFYILQMFKKQKLFCQFFRDEAHKAQQVLLPPSLLTCKVSGEQGAIGGP